MFSVTFYLSPFRNSKSETIDTDLHYLPRVFSERRENWISNVGEDLLNELKRKTIRYLFILGGEDTSNAELLYEK